MIKFQVKFLLLSNLKVPMKENHQIVHNFVGTHPTECFKWKLIFMKLMKKRKTKTKEEVR